MVHYSDDAIYSNEDVRSKLKKRRKMSRGFKSTEPCQVLVDNSGTILRTLKNLYRQRRMCDVTIVVGDTEHGAHRLILCASSDVFQAMLMKPEWTEWHETRIVLKELPLCESVFHLFLEYFYTGKILISHTNVMAVLALADKYLVKGLTIICTQYMCKHIAHAALDNLLFSWLQYTTTCSYKEVANLCENYIKWNFESVANAPDFSNFEVDLLCNLLKQNDLVIYNEIVLFNCVVRWLELQELRLKELELSETELQENMSSAVEAVMKCIRFPMMSPTELADLLLSPLLKRFSNILLERMTLGMLFQKGRLEENQDFWSSEEGKLLCTPRLYTCDSFNTKLLVENILNLPSYTVSTFVFSTRMSTVEHESDKTSEWIVDLYPKGVCFQKCFLIVVWQGTLEVPEKVKSTVRLSLTCRELKEDIKVRVAVLLYGAQGGLEHITQIVQKDHYFNSDEPTLIIDDLIPFEELNIPADEKLAQSAINRSHESIFLTGCGKDQLKINIIITPIRTE